MAYDKIECPKCKHAFAPTDEMSKKVRAELEAQFSGKEAELKAQMNAKFAEAVRAAAEKRAAALEAEQASEVAELQGRLDANEAKLRTAKAEELELRRAQRELEEGKRDMELTLTRKLDEERGRIREEIGAQMSDEHQLRQQEWEKKRADMERLIEDLKRKAEQGSQQAQGESFELSVEEALREAFKHDSVEPVEKGVSGADIALHVRTRTGQPVGVIIFELKRTKAFSPSWLPKLRDDQRAAKADLAVLVTTTMPDGVRHVGQVDGVWVADPASFIGLAQALRASLVEVAQARQAQAGRKEKAEEVYDYLNGTEFRGRVQALVETFVAMKEDVETERRAFEKIWAKRDKQLLRAMTATAGFYGELQGLGTPLQEIPALALEAK